MSCNFEGGIVLKLYSILQQLFLMPVGYIHLVTQHVLASLGEGGRLLIICIGGRMSFSGCDGCYGSSVEYKGLWRIVFRSY